jgi:hypothetical protein
VLNNTNKLDKQNTSTEDLAKRKKMIGLILLGLLLLLSIIALAVMGKLAQDPNYHLFSDSITYLSIPNALNVLSNIPFVLVGAIGVILLLKNSKQRRIAQSNRLGYLIFFAGIFMVGLGSAYYHWGPNNQTLVWDRLPMTIGFMALYSVIVTEFVSEKLGRILLLPLLVLGIFSVLYWYVTELNGVGDLRYYIVVQFFPILTIPVILIFFHSEYSGKTGYWLLIAFYALSKVFEYYDKETHDALVYLSGHSIKHILSALGIALLLKAYSNLTAKEQ